MKASEVCVVLQRIAIFQSAARRVVATDVHYQRIVRPLANFRAQRESAWSDPPGMITVRGGGRGWGRAGAARGAVLTADATGSVLGEINIVGQENGEGVR